MKKEQTNPRASASRNRLFDRVHPLSEVRCSVKILLEQAVTRGKIAPDEDHGSLVWQDDQNVAAAAGKGRLWSPSMVQHRLLFHPQRAKGTEHLT